MREETSNSSVDKSMNTTSILTCEACGFILTKLGRLNIESFIAYYWWKCKSCDRVWYIHSMPGKEAPIMEWKNYSSNEHSTVESE